MSKFAKWLLGGIGVLVLIGAFALVGANMYLQSEFTRDKLERKLSTALRIPIELDRVGFSPWSGMTVNGLRSPQQNGLEGNFLEAQTFQAEVRLLPLFQRKVSIRDVKIDQPHLTWIQNEKGRWKVPKADTDRQDRPEAPGKTDEPAKAKTEPKRDKAPPISFEISKAAMQHGTFEFLNAKGERIFAFEDTNATSEQPGGDRTTGKFNAVHASVRDTFHFQNLTSDFEYKSNELTFPNMMALIAGGTVNGSMTLKPDQDDTPYQTKIAFANVDVAQLLSEANSTTVRARGLVSGTISMTGKTSNSDTIKGEGHLQCDGGQLQQFDFLASLGNALGIDELVLLDLRNARFDFRIAENRVFVDSLLLESTNLKLSGTGKVKLNGKLDMTAKLTLNPKLAARVPSMLAQNFVVVEGGAKEFDFDIKGTIDNPKSNFLERLVGSDLERQATSLIKSLFGGSKKEKKTEKEPKAAEPKPSPEESPAQ